MNSPQTPQNPAVLALPTLSAVSPNQGPSAGSTAVTLTGTHFTGATSVRFGTTAASSFTVVSDSIVVAVAPAGTGTVQITVTAPGGTSNGLPYTYLATPALTSAVPNQGPLAGANTVTLTGTNLTTTTAVKFGTTAATSFTVVSDSTVTAVAPAGTGTVQITVTAPGGTSNGLPYTYLPAPVLTSAAPNQGPLAGANTVTLTGSNLTTTTAVKFGTTAATSFTVLSDTHVLATAPPGTAGPVSLTVTTPGGSTSAPNVFYYYVNTPTLTGVLPNEGPLAGANTVTLTGTNLTTTTAVRFGTTAATFTVVSDSTITAVAPAGGGTVQITVTAPGGTSNGIPYAYLPAPVLTSAVPGQGPLGGATVTLTGTNLTTTGAVTFGATAATSFTVLSDTQLVAVVPPGSAGPVSLTVTTLGGTSNGLPYTRLLPPGI